MKRALLLLILAGLPFAAVAQAQVAPGQKPPANLAATAAGAQKAPDPEAELQRALEESGNDRAALLRNLEDYLKRFPQAPRMTGIYRALVEAASQLNDTRRALDYAERIIALQPDDSAMMLLAVDLLEKLGDAPSLARAVGYVSRVLDWLEKTPPGEKPRRVSPEEWELERKKLRMSVYLIRGRLEMRRRDYDSAAADLAKSYSILPNAPAALRLGELAEIRKQYETAIEHYLVAFAMQEGFGSAQDRRGARLKLGNVWRLVHGSDAGLGDKVLAAYDRIAAEEARREQPERNADISDPFAVELRRLSGPPLKMAEMKDKVVVLNFWATWCLPCRELEPLIELAIQKYQRHAEVVFLAANRDEDETLVAPFVEREEIRGTVVFSDGLERILKVRAIPTVIVLDREGKIVYRAEGFAPEGFLEGLTTAIGRALVPRAPGAN